MTNLRTEAGTPFTISPKAPLGCMLYNDSFSLFVDGEHKTMPSNDLKEKS